MLWGPKIRIFWGSHVHSNYLNSSSESSFSFFSDEWVVLNVWNEKRWLVNHFTYWFVINPHPPRLSILILYLVCQTPTHFPNLRSTEDFCHTLGYSLLLTYLSLQLWLYQKLFLSSLLVCLKNVELFFLSSPLFFSIVNLNHFYSINIILMASHKERKFKMCALSLRSRNAHFPLKKNLKGSHKTNDDLIDLIGMVKVILAKIYG